MRIFLPHRPFHKPGGCAEYMFILSSKIYDFYRKRYIYRMCLNIPIYIHTYYSAINCAKINYCSKQFNKKMYIHRSKWTNVENVKCGRIIKPQGQK